MGLWVLVVARVVSVMVVGVCASLWESVGVVQKVAHRGKASLWVLLFPSAAWGGGSEEEQTGCVV